MKVIVKGRENRDQLEVFSIEEFVPAEHLLRKIDSAVDFSHRPYTFFAKTKLVTQNLA